MRKLIASLLSFFIPVRKWRRRVRAFINNFQIRLLFVSKVKYDFIFSLGEACFVAEYLKIHGQRKAAAPFDWVYGGTFAARIQVLMDEFKYYFDKKDLEYIDEKTANGAKLYRNNRTKLMYIHDFFGKTSFDEEYKIVAEKYKRRCGRIIDCLHKGGKLLCVYIEQVWKTPDNRPDPRTFPTQEEIVKLTQELNQKYNNQIDLVYFKINSDLPLDQTLLLYNDANLKIMEYHGALGGNATPEDGASEQIIQKIITGYLYYAKPKGRVL